MGYTANEIRNICLLGHGGDGKSALCESMLFTTKSITRLGKRADGTTVSDFDDEEKKRQYSIIPGGFLLGRILGEAHQEVAPCRDFPRFALEHRERSSHHLEVGALFKVGPFADGGAHHAHLAGQVSLEPFFVGGMEPAAVFYHVSQQLVGLGSFRAVESGTDFAVFLLQHGAAVGFDESLLGPVVRIFLHEEPGVAGFGLDGFRGLFHFIPGLGRVVRIQAGLFEQVRVDVEHRDGNGIGQPDLFPVIGLSQGQYVGQEVVLQEVLVLVVLFGQVV